jgi:hypothetical protein
MTIHWWCVSSDCPRIGIFGDGNDDDDVDDGKCREIENDNRR